MLSDVIMLRICAILLINYCIRKELRVAEIRLEYPDLQKRINESIKKSQKKKSKNSNDRSLPEEFEAAILTCLTKMTDDESGKSQMENYKLWEEQVRTQDHLPIGDNYIIIQDMVLFLIKKTIEKGTMAWLLSEAYGLSPTPQDLLEFGDNLIHSIKSLSGCDICLAYKAVDHASSVITGAPINIIKGWFPENNDPDGLHSCDMVNHDMHCSCDFFNFEDNLCTIREDNVSAAVESLEQKNIVSPIPKKDKFRFKI